MGVLLADDFARVYGHYIQLMTSVSSSKKQMESIGLIDLRFRNTKKMNEQPCLPAYSSFPV